MLFVMFGKLSRSGKVVRYNYIKYFEYILYEYMYYISNILKH